MPIPNFDGKTFVAFIDISGFKSMMKKDKAFDALDKFYSFGYQAIDDQDPQDSKKLHGIFISDSGILFIDNSHCSESLCNQLTFFLEKIKKINQKMLDHNYMLTTSISYGKFRFQDRIQIQGIIKNAVYGSAYISTVIDSENGTPKIQPGECRLVEDEEFPFFQKLEKSHSNDTLNLVIKKPNERNHLYYYWHRRSPDQIKKFEDDYKDSKYRGMITVMKDNS
jgi:hypothetical protein